MSGQWQYQRLASLFSRIYSSRHNPMYHLGALTVFSLAIALVTGIYLFLFFKIDPREAYSSTQSISEQWLGGLMRSLHRYSSDLLILLSILHLVHMLVTGKFRRSVSWLSGIGTLWIMWVIGLTGFMLVWDHKSKLLGILTSKLLAFLPIFPDSITGGFMMNDTSSLAGYFRMILFAHLALSVFVFILLWIHVKHLAKPRLIPSKYLMAITGFALLLACLLFPVFSDPSAESSIAPHSVTFDLYYLPGFYLMKSFSPAMNWMFILLFIVAISVLACIRRPRFSPARIDPEKCDACEQCSRDCPYNAIDVLEVNGERKAVLDQQKCLACGICIGSCKSFAIDMPGMPDLREFVQKEKKELAVFSCRFIPPGTIPNHPDISIHTIPCVGDVHAKKIPELFHENAKGIMLVSCEDCYHRFGTEIEEARIERKRRPVFTRKSSIERVRFVHSSMRLAKEIADHLKDLRAVDDKKGTSELAIRRFRPKWVPGALLWILLILALPLISRVPAVFYSKDQGTLVLNFKYTSTAMTVMAGSNSSLKHMQQKTAIATRRSPVEITIRDAEGKTIYRKIFRAKGIHEDMSVYVYDEIRVAGNIRVSMKETEAADKQFESQEVSIAQGHGAVIGFENDLKVTAQR
ncbi:MAG: 4Fe-4S binding protein [Bacteroidota bacterium]